MASTDPIKITVTPSIQELRARLKVKRDAVIDLRSPLAHVSVYLDQWVQKNFKGEGSNVGGWAPFSPVTLRIMELYDPKRAPAKLLQKTGALRLSFVPFADKKKAGIGSDLPYAKTHHEGDGHIPSRQLLPDKGAAKVAVIKTARDILSDYNRKALNK